MNTFMEDNLASLFEDSIDENQWDLDIEVPRTQKAITTLPSNFQILSMVDIVTLREYLATKYCGHAILYRGHESTDYRIESTIVRLLKHKKCSVQELVRMEKMGYDLFCKEIFQDEWLNNKANNIDTDLFKMSIGRHLGLPCRLIDVTARLETAVWFAVMNPKSYCCDGEIVVIILDNGKIAGTNNSPFKTTGVSYAHEPFLADDLDNLPLGEQRRFIQNGHFLWVDDNALLDEQSAITKCTFAVMHFMIPSFAKMALSARLYRDVYSGCAFQSEIENIKNVLLK